MSVLRNVLTYMGLGPDEDYDDGYLYEAADNEIDLTDHDHDHGTDLDDLLDGEVDELDGEIDPHAQRRRPGWLQPPAPSTAGAAAVAGAAAAPRRRISIDEDDADQDRPEQARRTLAPTGEVRPLRAVPPAEPLDVDDGLTVRPVPTTDDRPPEQPDALPIELEGESVRHVKPRLIAPESFGDAKVLADDFKDEVPVVMNLQGVDRELARRLIDFASGICYALDGSMEKIASQVFLLTPTDVDVSDEDRRRIEQRGFGR